GTGSGIGIGISVGVGNIGGGNISNISHAAAVFAYGLT
ncbi:MAG: hypothetical protein ACI81R_002134, partial [Bradymonadia bacterium]